MICHHIVAQLIVAVLAVATPISPRAVATPAGTVIPLGVASSFTILAKSGISTTAPSYITGNIGVAPIAVTAITGFSFVSADESKPSKSAVLLTGFAYGPSTTTGPSAPQGVLDMATAYTNGKNQMPATMSEYKGGALDGLTFTKGIYQWTTTVVLGVGKTLTLQGNKGDVFIFRSTGAFSTGANSKVLLSGGLTADTVYWVGSTSLTTYALSL
ncbi:hypothetical protein RQP46_006012 [Phenoliferia psychrophenolica]